MPAAVPGRLVICGTPIGNLGDITARALDQLRAADVIFAEDTRRTRKLLSHFDLHTPLVSCHEHNETVRAEEAVRRIAAGETVALVSDAGMPGISDPGGRVLAAAQAAGCTVTACPGPTAVATALVLSGFGTEPFAFLGFAPRKSRACQAWLTRWRETAATLVVYEAPGRLQRLLGDVAAVFGADHPVAVARELTKVHEEVARGGVAELRARFADESVRGECTVVVAPCAEAGRQMGRGDRAPAAAADWRAELQRLLEEGTPPTKAAAAVARGYGLRRKDVYAAAVEAKPRSATVRDDCP